MAVAPIVESIVKYREGRKWKERWCVLKKPSPVADCLSVVLYKDANKQTPKSNLVLDEFCGIDTTPFDGEKFVLSIICCSKTLFLSFAVEELREQWKEKLLYNFGKDICFKVEVTHGLQERMSGTGLTSIHSNLCNLFLTSSRISLTTTENFLLRNLYSWRYMDLKRYGSLGKNSYGIQVLFKEGEKNFVFKTHQSADIDKALKNKVQSLVQSCGLFDQLICSGSVTNQSAFPASASNPSTPTYCVSSESNKISHIDRRFSTPHSQVPQKSHDFCNSLENTLQSHHYEKRTPNSRNGSFCGSEMPEQPSGLTRHFSECNLHVSRSHRRMPGENLNSASSCEGSVENCDEPKEIKLNYINYEVTSKTMNIYKSEGLTGFSNDEDDRKPVCLPPPRSVSRGKTDKEQTSTVPQKNDFCFNEPQANIAMMNGGLCANKSIAFDPLQPLPYRDLSQYDGESDEGYLYWLPGSPNKPNLAYINISSLGSKDCKGFHVKTERKECIENYLKRDTSIDSLNSDITKLEHSYDPSANPSTNCYVNVLGEKPTQSSIALKTSSEENKENLLGNSQQLSLRTCNNDYIPINQLGSGLKSNSLKFENGENDRNLLVNDYLDMTGKQKSEEEPLEEMLLSKDGDLSEMYVDSNTPLQIANKELEDDSEKSDEDVGIDADLMKKVHMCPPLPTLQRNSESQEYINLSSVSIGEPGICLSPPPRPPKLLNCIREDASESSSPPPLPEKAKHPRGTADRDFAPLPIPSRRRDQSSASDSFPKPPLPRRNCHSPVNLHSSPPPGSSHHNRGSTLSSCIPGNHYHLGMRPVSASSVSRHRKPNLTVDLRTTSEIDHSKLDTPISVGSKWHLDDLNRSLPALAIYKPRNGKEYVDRRRLAEESSLPPHSAQRSPSVASSVFTFDDKSVASNPFSGWYSSGEDSPKYPSNIISSTRSSIRSMFDQKWSLGHSHRDMASNGSPRSYRLDCLESPRTFSTSTMDSIDTIVNYADIDVMPGDFKFAMAASPPPTPDNRTVYAKIDVAATSAASKVGRQHARLREDTLEKRAESVIFAKLQSFEGNVEKRKLSLDLRKQSSLSIKD